MSLVLQKEVTARALAPTHKKTLRKRKVAATKSVVKKRTPKPKAPSRKLKNMVKQTKKKAAAQANKKPLAQKAKTKVASLESQLKKRVAPAFQKKAKRVKK